MDGGKPGNDVFNKIAGYLINFKLAITNYYFLLFHQTDQKNIIKSAKMKFYFCFKISYNAYIMNT